MYVATENGGLFRTLDGGTHWSANLAGPELPGVMITRIETNPSDAADVFITVANFGNSHVFRSKDAGATWIDIDNGKLPDVPHHALLIRPDKPTQLYVCNDAGVFLTKDNGSTWTTSGVVGSGKRFISSCAAPSAPITAMRAVGQAKLKSAVS